jgi:hypothetical protein
MVGLGVGLGLWSVEVVREETQLWERVDRYELVFFAAAAGCEKAKAAYDEAVSRRNRVVAGAERRVAAATRPLSPQRWRRLHRELASGRRWWRTPRIRQDMMHVVRTAHRVAAAEATLRSTRAQSDAEVSRALESLVGATRALARLMPHPERIVGIGLSDLHRLANRRRAEG